jgi:hypothetical protein
MKGTIVASHSASTRRSLTDARADQEAVVRRGLRIRGEAEAVLS